MTHINNSEPLGKTLTHLKPLVSFDTQNPPKAITKESEIFYYLKKHLQGFDFTFYDAGNGSISLLATRGTPKYLFNFHIDTVPVATKWTQNPFELTVSDTRAIALGACDIKGATACMLTAASESNGDVALLFSSDEEAGNSEAVKYFLANNQNFNNVIVAEPTQAKAVSAHRGIQTANAYFSGTSGHASEARALNDNAIHKAGQWITQASHWLKENEFSFDSLVGIPFNVGTINGGIKANMIADRCELKFGFRQLPGQDSDQLLKTFASLAESITIKNGFFGPCLPASNQNFDRAIEKATMLCEQLKLPQTEAVNFWTEASLFSQAGMTAIVYGPGNIEQAHTADEWVELSQLEAVTHKYIEILETMS